MIDIGIKYDMLRRGQKEAFDLIDSKCGESIQFIAPTAYGKTFVALKYAVKMIEQGFSCVYTAPLKALTTEMEEEFKSIGLKVIEDTGENRKNPEKDYVGCDVVISTYERFDSVMKNKKNQEFINDNFGLIVVDECHTVHSENRGAKLESLITRIKYNTGLAILGLSATVSNYEQLGKFLKSNNVYVPKEERPVKQKINIQYYYSEWHNASVSERNEMMKPILNRLIATNKQALIFCSSRKRCSQLAKKLSGINETDAVKLAKKSNYTFHHAGLQKHQRKEIEQMFLDNKVKFIFCTPTLAMGVNLPAYAVIIYDTTRWNGLLGEEVLIDSMEIEQMVGRAGRPQYEKTCEVFIFAHKKYDPYIITPAIVKSRILENMDYIMNDWIGSYIDDKEQITDCLSETLLWQQQEEDVIKKEAGKSLSFLVNNGFANSNNGVFEQTFLGRMTSTFQIEPRTALHFKKIESIYKNKNCSDIELCAKLIETDEFLNNIRATDNDASIINLCFQEFGSLGVNPENFDERICKAIPLIFKTYFQEKYNVKIVLYRNDEIELYKLMERIFASSGVIIQDKNLSKRIKNLRVMVQNKTLNKDIAVLKSAKGLGSVRFNKLLSKKINTPEKFLSTPDIRLRTIMGVSQKVLDSIKDSLKEQMEENK